jgi:monoamine oxidase
MPEGHMVLTKEYDYVIVGAGIAGLHCALRISKAFPRAKIAITEMYDYVGGRIFTYHNPSIKVSWEAGAGRIHSSHKHITNYIKDYGLTIIPIPSNSQWIPEDTTIPEKDIWPTLSDILVTTLEKLEPKLLATHTVEQILQSNYATQRFPYKAEISAMRADLALKSLRTTLGSSEGFYVVKEGLSALTTKLRNELLKRRVEILYNHRLVSVVNGLQFKVTNELANNGESGIYSSKKLLHSNITLHAKKAILAIHSDALKSISSFRNLPALKHITMKPLLRTYGVFPSKAWFSGMPKTVTDSPLRHIIPINPKAGIIMTSYTDAEDTNHWAKIMDTKGEIALEKAIMVKTRELFPRVDIPNPMFFKAHHWKHGCSYWLPGLYDPKEESEKIMCPLPLTFPDIFVCGESYSLNQAWVEGAIEHAEEMLQKYIFR